MNYNNQRIFKSDKVKEKTTKKLQEKTRYKYYATCFTYETMNALIGSPGTSMSYSRLMLAYYSIKAIDKKHSHKP